MTETAELVRVIDTLADAFADLSLGRTESPPRTVLEHPGDRQLLVGPAVWASHGVASVKITTLTPANPARGLPLIHGVVVLTDLDTGRITAVLDGAELTAVRTGAVAGLATRLCTPADAGDVAVLGAGAQAHALVRAVAAVRPIRSVRVWSRTRARAERFAADVPVTVCETIRAAVTDAEIICTATATDDPSPLVAAEWIASGAHLNVIGGTHENACEVDPALLGESFVVVEQRAAAIADAGEVRAALHRSLIEPADLHELGELVRGTVEPDGRTTVFRGVGLAIEDTAAAVALSSSGTIQAVEW